MVKTIDKRGVRFSLAQPCAAEKPKAAQLTGTHCTTCSLWVLLWFVLAAIFTFKRTTRTCRHYCGGSHGYTAQRVRQIKVKARVSPLLRERVPASQLKSDAPIGWRPTILVHCFAHPNASSHSRLHATVPNRTFDCHDQVFRRSAAHLLTSAAYPPHLDRQYGLLSRRLQRSCLRSSDRT